MKPNPHGTDEEFNAYMRLEYLKIALCAVGLAACFAGIFLL